MSKPLALTFPLSFHRTKQLVHIRFAGDPRTSLPEQEIVAWIYRNSQIGLSLVMVIVTMDDER